jgi:hypothetical protein
VKRLFIFLLSLAVTLPLMAKDRPFIDEPDNTIREDFQDPEWKEGHVTVPTGYQTEDLQEFQLDNASGRYRYFIARSSLQSDADGACRFILVIRSSSGVENSSYEGMHCGAREYKVYAYGSQQGLKPLTQSSWQHITKSGWENYRNTLYNNLLCDLNTGKPNPPKAVFRAMENNTTVNHTPFLQN